MFIFFKLLTSAMKEPIFGVRVLVKVKNTYSLSRYCTGILRTESDWVLEPYLST